MIEPAKAAAFLAEFDERTAGAGDPAALAMRLLADAFSHYNWIGIYWLDGDTLVLGPFVGAPTEHDRIPVGRGVCGTAVAEGKNQVVPDVRQLSNYLACSVQTRSEIVVLIRKDGWIIGQIDADGHATGAFDESDEALLTAVAERIVARV
ncbi:GAF domain-containing protein [Fimbriiglobus ruber]|uniref:Free methionine-(R)-sulfoxide reductase, contains GAF domain n=1 Tax=Fimbriiglobus ruber TaxID=1908690 RepID=A0A225DNV9_9BACT|nr:GAF domain-containing protein [Fimbriiglobus ruber]OWK39166.1 Free methionine-(R)-sulfoxide reductase, contains GAF domain [Fimbriiglobus ruber]